MNSSRIFLILKGMAMGIAEIIPGVSGGTIAFITGIYETLLDSINAIKPSLINTFKNGGLKAVWKEINGNFLFFLFMGMGVGVLFGVLTISHLLDTYPNLVWALFFGIIFASVFYIGNQLEKWRIHHIALFIVFTLLTVWVTSLNPGGGSENLLVVFISGFIAISALMLPGISGSFMLLLMGMYTFIVHDHLKNLIQFNLDSLLIIGVFALGCLTGVFSFARLLQWTFKNYRKATLASLTGILLGSLYKIWPWRNPTLFVEKSSGAQVNTEGLDLQGYIGNEAYKLVGEMNVLPQDYYNDPQTLFAFGSFVIGVSLVYLMHRLGKK
jgi:putative membrane protein